ncbi:GNAT family N-acetyltransferase [Kocuria sp. KD4]|uniref:GNAT family N-acetyltransferase n=1 Tax=Kocuria sp. KD4 TaxID=2719588 RepID=UPI0014279B13|nr:GNAT family N-acetyltransferase [Kocuria sp. KD4]QIR70641.1 GNAT family N-acetyltransferase [Kocuria sp. KD4]
MNRGAANRPPIDTIVTERAVLEPLTVGHAVEMVETLGHPSLYEFIGGTPPSLAELRRRYALQSIGHSEDGSQWWLNWVVRPPGSTVPAGYVQATVESRTRGAEADLAWVIAPQFQHKGLATAATDGVIQWLKTAGIEMFAAYIHPNNEASNSVARRVGMHPTPTVEDGEIRWELVSPTTFS